VRSPIIIFANQCCKYTHFSFENHSCRMFRKSGKQHFYLALVKRLKAFKTFVVIWKLVVYKVSEIKQSKTLCELWCKTDRSGYHVWFKWTPPNIVVVFKCVITWSTALFQFTKTATFVVKKLYFHQPKIQTGHSESADVLTHGASSHLFSFLNILTVQMIPRDIFQTLVVIILLVRLCCDHTLQFTI